MNILLRPIRALACLLLLLETAAVLAPVPASATSLTVCICVMSQLLSTAHNGHPDGVLGNILSEIAHQEHWTLKTELCEWQDCVRKLRDAEIDLLPAVSLTAERTAVFDYHQTPILQTWSQV